MKRAPFLLLPLLVFLASTVGASERGEDALRRDIEFARRKVYPALVNISVVVKGFGGGRVQRFPAAGSGVIVSPAGHVLTNFHVAGETTRIVCTLPSRETIEAAVVAHDPMTDISVLQLKMDTRADPNVPVPFASLGDSDALRVGDYILAMGNPLSLSSSMTLGIVSNPKRVFTSFTGSDIEERELPTGQRTGQFTQWVQHDALILPGNSGGPLVNLQGEVVGINELGGNGVGFAIPSNLVAHVLNQALTYGEVRRGWLGLSLYPVGKLQRETGALISSVSPGSPGEKAGVKPGDILLAIDGKPANAAFFEEIPLLYKRVADLTPGSETRLRLLRGKETLEVAVAVDRLEKYLGEEIELRAWGITVRGITGFMALARKYPDDRGVLVTGVRPGFPGDVAKPTLRSGDVIRTLDGEPVTDLEGFGALVKKIAKGKKKKLLMGLRRGDQELLTVLNVSKKEKEAAGGELPMAWLGVRTQVLTSEVSRAMGIRGKKGFRVTQVYPDTEAAKAGLRPGDIIYALNGKTLRASRLSESEMLRRRIENLTIGTKATLSVARGKERLEIPVLLEETPSTAAEVKTVKTDVLEFSVRDITFMDRVRNKWEKGQQGVIVVEATSGGWASLGGLGARDLILSINGKPVADVQAFKAVDKALSREKPDVVRIFVKRGYRTAFVFLEPEWESDEKK
ncbi:MAG: PDZ domain-containing protein [Planctomycetota bacterium]|jgi:serine protease Do